MGSQTKKRIKLNIGASPIWSKEGWLTLDHKVREGSESSLVGDAANIPLPDGDCQTLFNSHMIEHIPHSKLEGILLEFNRVLEADGILRILTPDLKKIAKAYVEEDEAFFKEALAEDENIRQDLGFGGKFMNFVVSPGQDTALFDRQLSEFISGYAHLYLYDFTMLKIILENCGFNKINHVGFTESKFPEYTEPLHVKGLDSGWHNFNQEFYKKNNLIHHYDEKEGKYNINFKVTGFDRDPLTSLIIEAHKDRSISKEEFENMNSNKKNYNRYGQSLLKDDSFKLKVDLLRSISSIIDTKY
jgi:hypothetical protein